jgi:hypothetical protein
MAKYSNPVAHAPELERRFPVFSALIERGGHQSNIWIFDSPKINRRFRIQGSVAFVHCVLFEGDTSIKSYEPDPPPVYASIDGETRQTKLDAYVNYENGSTEWFEFKWHQDIGPARTGRSQPQLSAQAQAATAAGVRYVVRTDLDFRGKEILFDNWLLLCAAMTRCRKHLLDKELNLLHQRFEMQRMQTLGSLLEHPNVDRAYMLAAIAQFLQKGLLTSDLEHSLIGRESILTRSSS